MSYLVRNARRAKAHTAETPPWEVQRDTERGEVFSDATLHPLAGDKFTTISVLQAFCEVNNLQWDSADQYGEPGYTTPAKGILFCDWNDVPKPLQKRLEAQGFELEWSDEWYIDSDNSPSKAWRTQSDSHGWESRVRATDSGMLTPDDDAQEWIDDSLNEQGRPLPSWFDESELQLRGFAAIEQDDKEVGFHPGQDESPDKFMPALIKEGYDVVLQITDRGQFDTRYKIWTRREAKRGILFDEASGAYIPRRFAREIDRERCTFDTKFGDNGPNEPSDWDILEAGPEHEHYWEVWEDVLRDCELTMDDGTKVRLEQDGSVFYVETGAEHCLHEGKYYVHK